MAGAGRIYLRGTTYFIAYSHGGHEFRESTRSDDLEVAKARLAARLAACGSPVSGPRVPFEDLCQLYLEEYDLRQFRTPDTAGGRVKNLRAYFSHMSATAITTADIRQYQLARRRQNAAAATVNRETAALRRMFRLAIAAGRLTAAPLFPEGLPENPPRQGFFEHVEYVAVRAHLPLPYQDVLDFAYYSGWRHREITELTWAEVDDAGGVIRLDPARSKTGRGRVLPISPPLRTVLDRRAERRTPDGGLVFGRDGITVRDWRKAWPRACAAAGLPGRRLHDCRRTAARNLVRAGVPERVAMMLLGHATRSIFDRYNIVNERDLREAGLRLQRYLGGDGPPA
ncbi:MAG: tyrosine-type recombinase/integrase [Vicinamibacterales bacterium]